jgi:WD40 repeat protein
VPAEPAGGLPAPPSRGTFIFGIVFVAIAAALLAFVFAKLERRPNAGTLIYAGNGGIYEHDLGSGTDTKIASIPKDTKLAEPSPDGNYVAYGNASGALWLYEIRTKRRYQIADAATLPVGWSPDSKLVARELVGNGDVVLIDPNAGRTGLISGPPVTLSLPVWISSSRFAIGDLANPNGSLLVDTQASEQPVVKATFGVPLAASPDGTQLLSEKDHELLEGKVTPNGVTGGTVLFRGDATVAATSPQGFVAFAATDRSGVKGIWALESGTKLKRVVRGAVDWLAFTRDGSTICYAKDGAIYALTLTKPSEPKRLSRRGVDVLTLLSFRVVSGP